MGHRVFRSDKIFRLGALKRKDYRWMVPLALICLYYHETFPPLYILNRKCPRKERPKSDLHYKVWIDFGKCIQRTTHFSTAIKCQSKTLRVMTEFAFQLDSLAAKQFNFRDILINYSKTLIAFSLNRFIRKLRYQSGGYGIHQILAFILLKWYSCKKIYMPKIHIWTKKMHNWNKENERRRVTHIPASFPIIVQANTRFQRIMELIK